MALTDRSRTDVRLLNRVCLVILCVTSCLEISLADGTQEAPPSFLFQWGTPGHALSQFGNPHGLTLDAIGQVYVLDTYNKRIQIFDRNGSFVNVWGQTGTDPGQFMIPEAMAFASSGELVVVDRFNNTVQEFVGSGQLLRWWSGSELGVSDGPTGVAVDDSENVYVADAAGGKIRKFTWQGVLLKEWHVSGGPGRIAIDKNDVLYVTNGFGDIVKYLRDGTFVTSWHLDYGSTEALGTDHDGNVYVGRIGGIVKYSSDGKELADWGSWGSGEGQFRGPGGIGFSQDGRIYVVDPGDAFPAFREGRVQVFQSVPTSVKRSFWGSLKGRYR